MLVIGLTGSIGMGKSTAARRFCENGVAVLDADAVVHGLYEGKAVPLIEKAFPGTTVGGKVDRQALAQALIGNQESFARLEQIVHPLVGAEERVFLQQQASEGAEMAVLEIPLLFETGRSERVDVIVVVSAKPEQQRERVLSRPGMTEDKLDNLLARQLSDGEKRARADFVVDTSGPVESSAHQIDMIIESLKGQSGAAHERWWTKAPE